MSQEIWTVQLSKNYLIRVKGSFEFSGEAQNLEKIVKLEEGKYSFIFMKMGGYKKAFAVIPNKNEDFLKIPYTHIRGRIAFEAKRRESTDLEKYLKDIERTGHKTSDLSDPFFKKLFLQIITNKYDKRFVPLELKFFNLN